MRTLRWALVVLCIAAGVSARAQRVLVLPPAQTQGAPSTEWISTGLAVALDETLTQSGVPTVPFEDLLSYYDQAGLVDGPRFTVPSQIGLARQIGAGVLVAGTYEVSGETVSVHLQVLSVAGDLKLLGTLELTQNLRELLALSRSLGEELAKALGRAWTPPPAVGPEAFESYIRGRISNDPTLQEVFFRKALALQPDYYDAACTLALVLKSTGRLTEASALLTGIEKKSYPKAYLALLTLAQIRMDQGRLADARALVLASLRASESAEGHLAMAQWYARQKKTKEALTELVVAERFGTHQGDIDALRRQLQDAPPSK